MSIIQDISQNLQDGEEEIVVELVQKAMDEGHTAKEILEDGLLHGMAIVGELFKNDEMFVPEVLACAAAMNEGAALLKTQMAQEGLKAKGTVVIGTVAGDLHDIGKNLVKMVMEGYGLTVIDAGIDVPNEKFIELVKNEKPDVLGLSALLTTTMSAQENVIKALEEAGLRDSVKIMIGGAPVNKAFAEKIGADAYTPDAASAAEVAVQYCVS